MQFVLSNMNGRRMGFTLILARASTSVGIGLYGYPSISIGSSLREQIPSCPQAEAPHEYTLPSWLKATLYPSPPETSFILQFSKVFTLFGIG